MAPSIRSDKTGRSLLLIVSGIDLLLSAMIGAVLLTVVVMGAFGKGEVLDESDEADSDMVSPAIVEIWSRTPDALTIQTNKPRELLIGRNSLVEQLLPGAQLQAVEILERPKPSIAVSIKEAGVLVVTASDGSAWALLVNCDPSHNQLFLRMAPRFGFSGCISARRGSPVEPPGRVVLAPEGEDVAKLVSAGVMRPANGRLPLGYLLYEPLSAFASVPIGAWAVPQVP